MELRGIREASKMKKWKMKKMKKNNGDGKRTYRMSSVIRPGQVELSTFSGKVAQTCEIFL